MRDITVRPGPGVWIVETDDERLVYVKGSEAERAARERARTMAAGGAEAVVVRVFDLKNQPVAELVFHSILVLS
jgi:xanthine/CO dehydrogenase XdhC/CoxF family maturation factor